MVTGLVKMMEKCEEDHLVFYNRVRVALGVLPQRSPQYNMFFVPLMQLAPSTHQDGSSKHYTDCLYQGFLGV